MAIRNASNVTKAQQTITGQVPPNWKGTVIARIKKAEFAPSKSSGLPQLTWTCEIVNPLEVTSDFDGNKYSLDSKEFKIYLSLSEVKKDGSPSDALNFLINELHPLLGLPAEVDDENPNVELYEGICFQVLMESVQRKEQRRKADGTYEVVKDADGQEIVRGWEWNMVSARNILKKATTVPGRSF